MMSDEEYKRLGELNALIDKHGVGGTARKVGKAKSTISESRKRFRTESERRAKLEAQAESDEQQSDGMAADWESPEEEQDLSPFTPEEAEILARASKEGEKKRDEARVEWYLSQFGLAKKKEQ